MMNNYICLLVAIFLISCRSFQIDLCIREFILGEEISTSDSAKRLFDDLMNNYDKRVSKYSGERMK
jgi:hypothetical protein